MGSRRSAGAGRSSSPICPQPLPLPVPVLCSSVRDCSSERARIDLIRIREGILLDSAASIHAKRAADGYGRELRPEPQLSRNA